jgi:trafficking protein particle complex subunit 6
MAFDQSSAALALPSPDPTGPHVATSCFDFLLVELVPMAFRLASEIATREQNALGKRQQLLGSKPLASSQKQLQLQQSAHSRKHSTTSASTSTAKGTVAVGQPNSKANAALGNATTNGLGIGGIGGTVPGMDEDETREVILWKLDNMGYRVGLGIVDKFARDKPRFTDTLDVIKFLCKDLWILLFKKPIDNLKTNHRASLAPFQKTIY